MPAVRTTPAVRILMIACAVAYLLQMTADTFFNAHVMEWLGLVPYRVFRYGAVWQLFTYQFLHADLFHILFNMLVLWMIGSELEGQWGTRFFTRYYLFCGTAGGLLYILVQFFFRDSPTSLIPVVGSSGAVYGLLVAYGIIHSERMMLFMMVFPMKAKYFVLLLAGVEFVTTVFGSRSGVANLAHLGGMLAGFGALTAIAYKRSRARRPAVKRRRKKHLKLVINNDLLKDFDHSDNDEDDDDGSGRPISH